MLIVFCILCIAFFWSLGAYLTWIDWQCDRWEREYHLATGLHRTMRRLSYLKLMLLYRKHFHNHKLG